MPIKLKSTLTLSSALILSSCNIGGTQDSPTLNVSSNDYCISGGTIYTARDQNPTVDVVAVENGEITYAGDKKEGWCKTDTANRLDLKHVSRSDGWPRTFNWYWFA